MVAFPLLSLFNRLVCHLWLSESMSKIITSIVFSLFLCLNNEGHAEAAIQGAEIAANFHSIPYIGDIWTNTWGKDDKVYFAFGDATGMNKCLPTLLMDEEDEFDANYIEVSPGLYQVTDEDNEYCQVFGCKEPLPLCQYTPAGLLALSGRPPAFKLCSGPNQCVISRHIPYGNIEVFAHEDKPSSILAVNNRIYLPMHYPPGDAEYGYIAYSDDGGRRWKQVQGSPWHGDSPFQVLMLFNMGKNYALNRDGYLYGLGITDELPPEATPQAVYLTRVPLPTKQHYDPVLDYDAYEYFTGIRADGTPGWSPDPEDARPLQGLNTIAQGAAFYHAGTRQYLFLSGFQQADGMGALFAAPAPWGPWRKINNLPAGYIASVISKGATKDGFYFTAAGGGGVGYNLNIGYMKLGVGQNPPVTVSSMRLKNTRKVEQIIGDLDFETGEATRQQTESRFNILFTDLGSSFEYQQKLWFLFGDTDPESPGWDPRHDDAIAWTDAGSAKDFLLHFLTDRNSGRGILNPKISCGTTPDCVDLGTLNVPVAGLGDGKRMFVWFTTDDASRSLLARSDNNGRSFKKVYDFGRTHFIDLAVQKYNGKLPGLKGRGPWALIFGSGNTRHRDVYLAVTPLRDLRAGNNKALRFLSGIRKNKNGGIKLQWSSTEADSFPLFRIEHGGQSGVLPDNPRAWGFGEPLIHFNNKLGLWLATYNAGRQTIRLRSAKHPWGPWSPSMVLFDPTQDYGRGPAVGRYIAEQGELYGPYVIPRFTRVLENGDVRLYWLLSTWQPYVVDLMESTLHLQ